MVVIQTDTDPSDFIKKQLFYKTDRFSFGERGVGGSITDGSDAGKAVGKSGVARCVVELSERSYPTKAWSIEREKERLISRYFEVRPRPH
jgi:hypothetical protein